MHYLNAAFRKKARDKKVCAGKVTYADEIVALAQAAMTSGPQVKMVAVGCPTCNQWHVEEERKAE